ncbi:hypothetical protein KUCAC02_021647 [Chaenocephalus aceratus]|nr:hypothetical protein KUCAC02_021647 [Chaenocephalus aceratus]
MTRRLSSSTRSHTEDSIFLRPEEDPVWLDEPTKTDKKGHGARKKDKLKDCKDGLAGDQSPEADAVFIDKVYAVVIEIHFWAALFAVSQVTVSLHVLDFYLGFIIPCHPILGMDSMVLMGEVVNTKEHNWIVNGTAGIGVAICVIMVIHMVRKWRYGTGLVSFGTVSRDIGDRRQSVSRQPSFTLSEWTDAQEDLMDMETEPQTPVFEMGSDNRMEGDAATLLVTPVGLQERQVMTAESWGELL